MCSHDRPKPPQQTEDQTDYCSVDPEKIDSKEAQNYRSHIQTAAQQRVETLFKRPVH